MTENFVTVELQRGPQFAVVTGPNYLKGRYVVQRIDADPCGGAKGMAICGLVKGHAGSHWECAPELVELEGPFALIKQRP